MKKIIIGAGLVVVVLLIFAGLKLKSSVSQEESEVPTPSPTIVLPTISSNVSVELNPKDNNRAVTLVIKGIPSDVESVEYEITYLTGSKLPRGVLGKINTNGKDTITRDEIVLGTCSSGKCVYDTGVTSVDLSLKFNTASGASVFRKSYPLP
jgi:hypothetical protein